MPRATSGEPIEWVSEIRAEDKNCFLCQESTHFPENQLNCIRWEASIVSKEAIESMMTGAGLLCYVSAGSDDTMVYVDFAHCEDHESDWITFSNSLEEAGELRPQLIEAFLSSHLTRMCDCDGGCGRSVEISRRTDLEYHMKGLLIIVHRCPNGPGENEEFVSTTEHYNVYQGVEY